MQEKKGFRGKQHKHFKTDENETEYVNEKKTVTL